EDPGKLVDEAKKRDELHARLVARAEGFKSVDVAVHPALKPPPADKKTEPKGLERYNLNPKAEITVLFCSKMRVVLGRGYAAGGLNEAEIDKILGKVKETLEPAKKKAEPAK